MRFMLVALVVSGVAVSGCGRKGCEACDDPDRRDSCESSVNLCNALGPVGLAFRKDCLDSAYDQCEFDDTSTDGSDTDNTSSVL